MTMDPKTIATHDLKALIAFSDVLARAGNRYFADMFKILMSEALARHETTEMQQYSDRELIEGIERLKVAVDDSRAAGLRDDYPALEFTRLALAAAIEELERREREQTVQ